MDKKKILAYSLLAHVHTSGLLISDLIQVFIPLVKKSLSNLCQRGLTKDEGISTVQAETLDVFGIDIPIPILKLILAEIASEFNTEHKTSFVLYDDSSFILDNFLFDEYDEVAKRMMDEISKIEGYFKEFCRVNNIDHTDYGSIFKFIELNKLSLSKYFNEGKNGFNKNQQDFSVEAQFLDFFRQIPSVFDQIKSIYLGSIISSYLDYQPGKIVSSILLVLDTNFITSLMDLDTPDSFDTCNKLVGVCHSLGYKLCVLSNTLDEASQLIHKMADSYDKTFLIKRVYKEGIYSACERRGLNKADLNRLADNLEDRLREWKVDIVPVSASIINKAKFSDEYEKLKRVRTNDKAALHDAVAIYFVREKRSNKRIKRFEDVTCWFVNNSTNPYSFTENKNLNGSDNYQQEAIKVDDLLNIFWLSNPNFSSDLSIDNLVEIGLHTLISLSINDRLPKTKIIRELDENIQKYAKERLSERDVVLIATRISQRNLTNIEQLNELANSNPEEFVKSLQAEAAKQDNQEEERNQKFERLLNDFQSQTKRVKEVGDSLDRKRTDFVNKEEEIIAHNKILRGDLQNKERELENYKREVGRKKYIDGKLKLWRRKAWVELVLLIIAFGAVISIYCTYFHLSFSEAVEKYSQNKITSIAVALFCFIISGLSINSLISKYRNHSNIKAYVERLDIPDDFKPLK